MNLQRLAELINEKLGQSCQHFEVIGYLSGFEWEYWPLATDRENARFIIWCLDRLEELGLAPLLRQEGESYALVAGSDLGQGFVEIEEDGTETVDGIPYRPEPFPVARVAFTGATRAEACALALMQALEGK